MLSATATAQLPAGLDVEFDRRLAELGDEHYQRTSHAYKGLGRRPEGGLLGVEHFPLAVIVNRHRHVTASAEMLLMESPRSQAYVLGIAPLPMWVRWTMRREGGSLVGRLEVGFHRRRLDRLAQALGLRRMLAVHAEEEMVAPARDRSLSVARQRRLAERLGGDLLVAEHVAHSLPLDPAGDATADRVLRWLQARLGQGGIQAPGLVIREGDYGTPLAVG